MEFKTCKMGRCNMDRNLCCGVCGKLKTCKFVCAFLYADISKDYENCSDLIKPLPEEAHEKKEFTKKLNSMIQIYQIDKERAIEIINSLYCD